MTGDIKWNSMSKGYGTPAGTGDYRLPCLRGSRPLGTPLKQLDRASRYVMVMMSVFALVMLAAVDGFYSLLWLFVAGPMALGFAMFIANAGGTVWSRLVATGYTACVFIGVGLMMAWS